MPIWPKVAAGLVLAASLLGLAGFHALSERRGPLVQAQGTTYYNGEGPVVPPVICKPESQILAAVKQVHAKYDQFTGEDLKSFQDRARDLEGLPPLDADELFVITEDDKLRDGEMVLFIGLKGKCVSSVFGFPARLYRQIAAKPGAS